LELAFAKTIHTCQGITIGKNLPDKPTNVYEMAIIDLGPKTVEGWGSGLTYSAVSRGKTLGSPSDLTQSAIYFDGKDTNALRFQNIHLSSKGLPLKLYLRKQKWTKHLIKNKILLNYDILHIENTFNFFKH
jgi:hypothetical protein